MALHPRWSLQMATTPRRTFRNVVGHAKGVHSLQALNDWSNNNLDPHLDWGKVRKLRDKWGGKVILRILDPDDARAALDVRADTSLVGNHGGRQLDGALSTIRALPGIVQAVGGRTQVYLDGGIRSGQDVLKARFGGRWHLHRPKLPLWAGGHGSRPG